MILLPGKKQNATTLAQEEGSPRRYRRPADECEILVDPLYRLQQDKHAIVGYITETCDALSATAIQDQALAAINTVVGNIKSLELLSASNEEGHPDVRRIGLRIRLTISIEGLASAMHAFEDAEPCLFVRSLQANASRRSQSSNQQEPRQALSAIEALDHGTYSSCPGDLL